MDIEKIIKGKVKYNERMEEHTTFGIGGPVDIFIEPVDSEDLANAVKYLVERGIRFFPLGMGSNVLVSDSGFRGTVINLKGINKVEKIGENSIFGEAGAPLSALVEIAATISLSGLEFASGIPGSVGGAVVMNAGAYGEEMEGVVDKIMLITSGGEMTMRERRELTLKYRGLVMGEGEIITGAVFTLQAGDEEMIREKMRVNNEKRRERHPVGVRSAGSVFKNIKGPKAEPAGKIIEGLGLKGKRVGNAEISPLHGNFIVNHGGAKAADVLGLIEIVKGRVKEERGIDLKLEIKILGEV